MRQTAATQILALESHAPKAVHAASPNWADRSLLRDRRALAVGLSISLFVHAIGYWLAPGLTTAWKDASLVTYALSLAQRPARAPDQPAEAKPARRALKPTAPPVVSGGDAIHAAQPASMEVGSGTLESASALATDSIAERLQDSLGALPVIAVASEPAKPAAPETARAQLPGAAPGFDLPGSVSITFSARSSITDGVAHYTWKREAGRYETQSTLQATGFFVSMFAGVMHQVSRGAVTESGLAPEAFQFRRGDSAPDTAEFARASGELKLARAGGAPRSQPLPPAIQDTQSFVFHLAYLLAQNRQRGQAIELMVTNARKVYRYGFQVIDTGSLETPLGVVEAVHLKSEAADPTDAYEVWLAPSYYNLPVRLKFFAGRFPIELVATSIGSER